MSKNRKQDILRAAARCLSRNVMCRLQNVADELHMAKSGLHHHYQDKAGLVREAYSAARGSALDALGATSSLLDVCRDAGLELSVISLSRQDAALGQYVMESWSLERSLVPYKDPAVALLAQAAAVGLRLVEFVDSTTHETVVKARTLLAHALAEAEGRAILESLKPEPKAAE